MVLDNRKISILWTVLEEHVRTAEPVGSQAVGERGGIDASPATIRNEMGALEEEGYLTQPYTSAGRVPTERAYRLYVEYLLRQRIAYQENLAAVARILTERIDTWVMARTLARALAPIAGAAVIVGIPRGDAYGTGLSYVIVQPEFHDPELLCAFSTAFDRLEETLAALEDIVRDDAPTVVLGAENPFGGRCGTILSRLELPAGEQLTLGIVGPMRMAYAQHLGMLLELQETARTV